LIIFHRCGSPGAGAIRKFHKYQNISQTQKLSKLLGFWRQVEPIVMLLYVFRFQAIQLFAFLKMQVFS
jgi:hypothetical protein